MASSKSHVAATTMPEAMELNREVFDGARQGDHQAFRALVAQYDRGLRVLAYRLLGDAGRMDDVLQEAYMKAYRALPAFRGDSSLATWLYRITYNACLDELRRSRNDASFGLDQLTDRPSPGPGPAERAAERQALSAALSALPPDQRAAVLLVDAEGFDYEAAARVLGIPEGTLRSRLSRARAGLRRALSADDCRQGGQGG